MTSPNAISRYMPVISGSRLFAASVANSETICMADSAAFSFIVPPGTTSTTVVWHASDKDTGPYYPIVLPSGSQASTAVTAGNVYIAPPELYSCKFVRGTATVPFSSVIMLKT